MMQDVIVQTTACLLRPIYRCGTAARDAFYVFAATGGGAAGATTEEEEEEPTELANLVLAAVFEC